MKDVDDKFLDAFIKWGVNRFLPVILAVIFRKKLCFRLPTWREGIALAIIIVGGCFLTYHAWFNKISWEILWIPAVLILPFILKTREASSKPETSNQGEVTTVPTAIATPSILVFLPDWTRKAEEAFYQDGAVQKEGFDQAEKDAEGIHNKLSVEYQPIRRDEPAKGLLDLMKKLYAEKQATYFIVTMSSAVEKIRQGFADWHKECVNRKTQPPILIATVASAPGIADASGGIVRWYVRSQEESSLLALYFHWKMGIRKAAVFLVDDSYGNHGRDVFRDRFLSLSGFFLESLGVTATNAKTKVAEFLNKHKADNNNKTGVLVVGYGDMLSATVTELIQQQFIGTIACTSTLTGTEWQPKDRTVDEKIFTVLPRHKNPHETLKDRDRDVVFYFSKSALYRVLELTAKNSDSKTFLERWRITPDGSNLCEEYLANGDTIIQLDVVGSNRWR
jgi:hypothetical protein